MGPPFFEAIALVAAIGIPAPFVDFARFPEVSKCGLGHNVAIRKMTTGRREEMSKIRI
jgi:hypothetical protein